MYGAFFIIQCHKALSFSLVVAVLLVLERHKNGSNILSVD